MTISKEILKNGAVKLTVAADEETIKDAKKAVIDSLRSQVKAPGFRAGQAPDKIVEKQLGEGYVQNQVIEQALGRAYAQAAQQEQLKVIGQPQVELTKFVPYSVLEFTATVEVTPDIKLPDYTKLKAQRTVEPVKDEEIEQVLQNLQTRMSESKEVRRPAKDGDKVWIDFKGSDQDGQLVSGASGDDYPLVLGTNTFIKGFEPEIEGLKAGDTKTFDVTFPKDYHVKTLQAKPVTFEITVKKVEEVAKPALDDKFASSLGPFKTLDELKTDIKKQLEVEKEQRADSQFREDLIAEIIDKTKFEVPPQLLANVKKELKQELLQNLQYRGLTLEQYLASEDMSEEDFENKDLVDKATRRAKASLILTELAEAEKMKVTATQIDERLSALKQQYSDDKMQEELGKPDARREVAAQMLTEKTIDRLVSLNS